MATEHASREELLVCQEHLHSSASNYRILAALTAEPLAAAT